MSAAASDDAKHTGSSPLADLATRLRGKPIIAVIIAAAACIAMIIALLLWASRPQYRVLFSNLSEADGGAIITELDSRGIPYRFASGGNTLLVPGDQVPVLRLQLAEKGLPHAGNVGLELMDHQEFGISQFAEQINYQRGLEGELARSITSLGPVASARVHLALSRDSVFVRKREPAKASVMLSLEPGRQLSDGQIAAIVHLVSSSVPDLANEGVTVVDQSGRLLSSPTTHGMGLDGTQLDYVSQLEQTYQQRIEDILTPILGPGNVKAQVTAQIDFSRREETSEQYSPNQPPNEATVRSRQSSLDYNGQGNLASGIPGALSNTPPGTAPSPIDNGTAGANDEATSEESANGRMRRDDVINYEVDRLVSHVQHQRGQIQRLSAAVVVNYQQVTNDNGVTEPQPLASEQLAQIEGLVHQAMGFSEERGDALTVVNSPFSQPEGPAELAWWRDPGIQQLALSSGRYLLVGLAILLLYLLVLRPVIRRYTESPVMPPAAAGFHATVGEDDQAAENDSESTDGGDDTPTYARETKRQRKATTYEQHLNDLREMAQEDPRMIAMIVRGWINDND
ncbi:flagellar basal-body MS-ring/collar protein FliF [Halomonas cupida]|uniref:flagellar basal-body MS-ring/collar protein FliF n=1 Tax=Halomonas cupida TaxID=44933 RepID=UPI003A8D1D81